MLNNIILNIGFSCCKNTKDVVYRDSNGKWGVENNTWCGI